MTNSNKLEEIRIRYLKEEQEFLDTISVEERTKIGSPIKNILHLDSFMANGNKYIIRTSLTLERYEKYEEVQIPMSFGVTFRNLFENMRKTYDCLNDNKIADASVTLYNIMNGMQNKLEKRTNEVLSICTLFVCREGEDTRFYDKVLADKKIQDWKKEGISMDDFFQLAFNSVPNFLENLKRDSASSS